MLRYLTRPKADEPLQVQIDWYVKQGYRVVSQTDTAAQLVKPKVFSFVWFVLMLGVFYLPYYLAKRDKQVYLRAP